MTAFQGGQLAEAQGYFQRFLSSSPSHAPSWYYLGHVYYKLGKKDLAQQAFQKAVACAPGETEFHLTLGLLWEELGHHQLALQSFQQVVALNPTHAQGYRCLGQVLQKANRVADAIQCYRQAIAINPKEAATYNTLGRLLMEVGQPEEAIRQFEHALALKPDYPNAQNNLGCALNKLGEIQQVMALYNQILQTHPDNIDAHLNRGIQYLLMGDYVQGWSDYEWRLRTNSFPPVDFPKPMWAGEPLPGKTILVIAEQGFGDTLQFLRYLPLLKQQGATVIFACQPALYSLLKTCPWIDTLVVRSLEMIHTLNYDTYIYLMSLPERFQTTVQTIPQATDLLRIPEGLVHSWHKNRITTAGLNVGIAWAITSSTSPTRHYRSCPLEAFACLAQIPQLQLYSLQKGAPHGPQGADFSLRNLEGDIPDFLDTAAAIMALDLVITVDTAVAHLAGTLQKPVWILLPYTPDWRWLLRRQDSLWYPSARLYAQGTPGDWPGVFRQVLPDLKLQAAYKTS